MTDESEPESWSVDDAPGSDGSADAHGSGGSADAHGSGGSAEATGSDRGSDGSGSAERSEADASEANANEEGANGGDADEADASEPRSAGASTTDVDAPEDIDPSELTVEERSLHPRIRLLWIGRAILMALVMGALVYGVDSYLFGVGPLLPAAVAAGLAVVGVVHALLRYRVWRYEVREDALYLERGVITRVRTVVPFVRIQHVDTRRGPVERASGLATSVVYTAGSRGADVAIPGLEGDRAADLQHRLKRLAIASEADTSV